MCQAVTQKSYDLVAQADAVLVGLPRQASLSVGLICHVLVQALGTTFQVWSAFRLARRAVEKTPSPAGLVIGNLGPTRADGLGVKLDMDIAACLAALFPHAAHAVAQK